MPLKLYRNLKKSPNWYIRGSVSVWRDGQRHSVKAGEISTGASCEHEAQAILEQHATRLREESLNNRPPEPSFDELAYDYLQAGGEARFLKRILDRIAAKTPSELDQKTIDSEGRKAYPGAHPATLRRQWHGPISAVLRHHDPSRVIRRPKEGKGRISFLTPGAAERIITAAASADRRYANVWTPALVTFLIGVGARESEALRLDAADVFLDYGYAILREPKNGAERVVTISNRVRAALSTLPNLGERGPVFRSYSGKPYTVQKGRGTRLKAVETSVIRAGLDPHDVTEHILRHTWATWAMAVTKDLVRIRDEAGWGSLALADRYVKFATPGLAKDVKAHGWSYFDTLDEDQVTRPNVRVIE